MSPLMDIAERHNLIILEDAAQSHGAKYFGKAVGSFGTGAFSLYPTKNMTSAEGGMITTNDHEIAESCRVIRQHGMRRRYYHDELGFNFRMTDIHAAIGLEQLKKLAGFNRRRQENARFLSENLQGVVTPIAPPNYDHVYHQYTIRVAANRRGRLVEHLQENGVGHGVYYPVPIHKQTVYCDMGYDDYLPVTEQTALEVLSLPVHPSLTDADLETIVSAVNSFTQL
jgi:dTDP-4-amino-4,6-dideoxygalactose transaminase